MLNVLYAFRLENAKIELYLGSKKKIEHVFSEIFMSCKNRGAFVKLLLQWYV